MTDDNGIAIFRYPNGPLVEIVCSFTAAAAEVNTEIYGDNGYVVQRYGDGVSSPLPRAEGAVGLRYFVKSENAWHDVLDIPSPNSQAVRIGGLALPEAEFFHGTLELVEKETTILMLYGEDASRPQMDRVYRFASQITDDIMIFDTRKVELPVAEEYRQYLAPLVIYSLLERFSCHLEDVRGHSLNMRRYYRQFDY